MKKILIVFVMFLGLLLVACTETKPKVLPDMNDNDRMELTLAQKIDFLSNLEAPDLSSNALMLNLFSKMNVDFAVSTEQNLTLDIRSNVNQQAKFNADLDVELYGKLGDSASSSIVYANLKRAFLSVEQKASTKFMEDDISSQTNITVDFSNSFFLIHQTHAYYQLNGLYDYNLEQNGEVLLDEKDSFDNLQEKVSTPIFTESDYQELIEQLSFFELPDTNDLDLNELFEAFETISKHIEIYKTNDTYTIRILADASIIRDGIDEMKKVLIEFYDGFESNIDQEILTLFDKIKDSIKSFDLDFRVEVVNHKITRILFGISGHFQFEKDNTYPLTLNVNIERLGFILDLNPTAPNMPSTNDLANFKVVEYPSFIPNTLS